MKKVRPRLADHALARRHLRDGEEVVVIHDARDGSLCSVSPDTFALALCADGTRDLEGVALAASRAGIYTRLSEIRSALDDLDALGLLEEGVEPGPIPRTLSSRWEAPVPEERSALPLEHLPDYGFRCSGCGHCCRQYASVAFTAADVQRARNAGLSALPGDAAGERVFLPLYGAVRSERVAMTMSDGACLQLGADSRCGLEVRGGPLAKPVGCRSYPATLVDDGESVRVSVAAECDCVFESRAGGSREPLVPGATAADIEAGLTVRRLADEIEIGPGHFVERSEYVAWSRRVAAAVESARVPERSMSLAATLARGSLGGWPTDVDSDVDSSLLETVRGFAATMARAAASAESWRSGLDRTRILRRAVADAAAAATTGWPNAVPRSDDEALAVRAAIFGHLLPGGPDVAGALAALAARIVVARVVGERSPELGHPIAAVFAASRGATG